MSEFMYHAFATANMLVIFTLLFMMVFAVFFEHSIASRFFARPKSNHFDGLRFFNPVDVEAPARSNSDRRSVWVWLLTRSRGAWKKRAVTPRIPRERVHEGIEITYINHATVLVQYGGFNILTDPVWSYRVSPLPLLGPVRYADPGVRFEDLPPIDVVLLSHNHYDHMDIPTLRRVAAKWKPLIYTGLGNASYLERKGIHGAIELDWWEHVAHGPLRVTATPARHFSSRSVSDRNYTLWCGFVIEADAGRVYFAGDTGYGSFIREIADRFPVIDVALLPIGAYDPSWMMQQVHTNPHEAIKMHDILKAKHSIGIHFGTFRLTDEPQDEPAQLIEQHRGQRDFRALENGATVLMKGSMSENS